MKLHYSQTIRTKKSRCLQILLPYEITLFSNQTNATILYWDILLPYEITLFSNSKGVLLIPNIILLPYEITLFSNLK